MSLFSLLKNPHANHFNNLAKELAEEREDYQYNYTYLEPLAMLEDIPRGEKPSLKWWILVIIRILQFKLNSLVKDTDDDLSALFQGLDELEEELESENLLLALGKAIVVIGEVKESHSLSKEHESLNSILNHIKFSNIGIAIESIVDLVQSIIESLHQEPSSGRPGSLDDYAKLFKLIPLPEIANNFQEDLVFAQMRVAGPNPVMIEQMTKPDPRFPVTDEQYKQVMGDSDSLTTAMEAGRVYLADYAILDGATNGTYPKAQKYLCAPLAMFAVPQDNDKWRPLRPIAIQCGQKPGAENPIFTPQDGTNWQIAKTIVQIADGNFHEAVSHLGRTHLLIEPFVIATHRQLPSEHPLSILLLPHFEGTIFINDAAQKHLIAPKGGVNGLLAPAIDTARAVAIKGAQSYLFNFNDSMFPKTLASRGVDKIDKLPVYPYRDDGLLLWHGIRKWVSDYLTIHYGSPGDESNQKVLNDEMLQKWLADLLSYEGGRMNNIGEDGKIRTLDYLIDVTTMVIFTSSAQHAAVNFPQYPLMSYAPAMPMAGYCPKPNSSGEQQSFLDIMPPIEQANSQLFLLYLLGSVYHTQLGDYDSKFIKQQVKQKRKEVQAALQKFQDHLEEIESQIEARNAEHPEYAYQFLLPSKIPQSINV